MEKTKSRILKALRNRQGYLSGQELCEQLEISRTAVWKNIKALEAEGYEIEAVQNKGYCLKQVPDVMGAAELESLLSTKWVGKMYSLSPAWILRICGQNSWQKPGQRRERLRWPRHRREGGAEEGAHGPPRKGKISI